MAALDDAYNDVGVAFSVASARNKNAHITATHRSASGLVIHSRACWNMTRVSVKSIISRQSHDTQNLTGMRQSSLPESIEKTRVVLCRPSIGVGPAVFGNVFHKPNVATQIGIVTLQEQLRRRRSTRLLHNPVRRRVVALLNHQLHVPAAGRSVDESTRFHLMKKGESEVWLDHARGLKRSVFINAGQFFPRGEIMNQPRGSLIATDDALCAQRFDVVLNRFFDFTVDLRMHHRGKPSNENQEC